MFQWDKSINAINISASKVVHLFRSMREVQLALPGVAAQQASAFLCQYQVEAGIATAVVFHLHKSHLLAFYFSNPRIVPEKQIDSMLDKGLNFVESMGFLMTDQDIHLLNEDDQEMLWVSLPLMAGLQNEPERVVPAATSPQKPADKAVDSGVKSGIIAAQQEPKRSPPVAVSKPVTVERPSALAAAAPKVAEVPETVENVNDLLAAVDAMRAKRPGLRARKTPPAPEEMERRRLLLRETIGRILASL
jgi:hypothetical protein